MTIAANGASYRVAVSDGDALSVHDFASGAVVDGAGVVIANPEGATGPVRMAASPDGNYLAAGHTEGVVSLWSTATLRFVTAFRAYHADLVRSVRFSPGAVCAMKSSSDTPRPLRRLLASRLRR